MNTPTPDRMPEDFDELDTARPLFPLPRGPYRFAIFLGAAAILTGIFAALVDVLV